MNIRNQIRAKQLRRTLEHVLHEMSDSMPDGDDILETIGLQRRRSAAAYLLPAVGTLVVGAAIGSALGLLFGPRYGSQLLDRYGEKLPEPLREATKPAASTEATRNTTLGTNHVAGSGSALRSRSEVQS